MYDFAPDDDGQPSTVAMNPLSDVVCSLRIRGSNDDVGSQHRVNIHSAIQFASCDATHQQPLATTPLATSHPARKVFHDAGLGRQCSLLQGAELLKECDCLKKYSARQRW